MSDENKIFELASQSRVFIHKNSGDRFYISEIGHKVHGSEVDYIVSLSRPSQHNTTVISILTCDLFELFELVV